MEVTHARVCYVDDKMVKIVSITAIKNFHPKNDTDFDKKKIYQVQWADKTTKKAYYKANILLLGTSINDIKNKIQNFGNKSSKTEIGNNNQDEEKKCNENKTQPSTSTKKQVTPKLKRGAVKNNRNDKEQQQMQKKAENELASKILTDKIASIMKAQNLQQPSTEGSSSSPADTKETNKQYDFNDHMLPSTSTAEKWIKKNKDLELELLKKEQERERLAKELAFYKKDSSNDHQEETNEEAPLNIDDDEKLSISSDSFKNLGKFQENQSKSNEMEDEDSFQSEDENSPQLKNKDKTEMHHLGDDIYIPKETWDLIVVKEPKKFVRDLTEAVWPRKQLQNRCFDLKKATNLENRSPRKQFSPKKVRLIKEAYRTRLACTGLSGNILTQVTNGFKRIISEKVNDLNKNVKKIKRS